MSEPRILFEPGQQDTTFTPLDLAPLSASPFVFPMGYQNVTDDFLTSDPPRPEELSALLSVIELHLDDVARVLGVDTSPHDGRTVLDMTFRDGTVHGVGPIFETIAAVELGAHPFDPTAVHGFELTRAAAEDVFRTLATESLADRLHNPGLSVERGPTIVGGCCLVVGAFRRFDLKRVVVDGSRGAA